MQNDNYRIYNLPEEISGVGVIAHFIGLLLFIVLYVAGWYLQTHVDNTMFQDLLDTVVSSGIVITIALGIIFIVCPIYFFIRIIMEFVRTVVNFIPSQILSIWNLV